MLGMFQHRIVVSAPALKHVEPCKSTDRQRTAALRRLRLELAYIDAMHSNIRVAAKAVDRLHVKVLGLLCDVRFVQVP